MVLWSVEKSGGHQVQNVCRIDIGESQSGTKTSKFNPTLFFLVGRSKFGGLVGGQPFRRHFLVVTAGRGSLNPGRLGLPRPP